MWCRFVEFNLPLSLDGLLRQTKAIGRNNSKSLPEGRDSDKGFVLQLETQSQCLSFLPSESSTQGQCVSFCFSIFTVGPRRGGSASNVVRLGRCGFQRGFQRGGKGARETFRQWVSGRVSTRGEEAQTVSEIVTRGSDCQQSKWAAGRGWVQRVSEWAGRGVDFAGDGFLYSAFEFFTCLFVLLHLPPCMLSLHLFCRFALFLYGVNRICRPTVGNITFLLLILHLSSQNLNSLLFLFLEDLFFS